MYSLNNERVHLNARIFFSKNEQLCTLINLKRLILEHLKHSTTS